MNIPDPVPTSRRITLSPVRLAALAYGIVFLLVGLAGFVPGLTADVDALRTSGHHSGAMLLGLFQVSLLHNVLHLVLGMVGIAVSLASWPPPSRWFLRVGGLLYLGLWLYGLMIDKESAANVIPLNTADDWLHFALGLTMIALSFLPRYSRRALLPDTTTRHRQEPAR